MYTKILQILIKCLLPSRNVFLFLWKGECRIFLMTFDKKVCQFKMKKKCEKSYIKTLQMDAIFLLVQWRAWILDVMLIALVSKVTLLEWLSKFVQCWVPRESVLQGSGTHKATSTAQNLKVTLIEWHLKLKLLALHQVFTPSICLST